MRHALFHFIFIIFVILGGRWLYKHIISEQTTALCISEKRKQEIERFGDKVKKDSIVGRHKNSAVFSPEEYQLFCFDPNTADSLSLLKLGIKEWQIRNLMKYRRKGGRWKTADDFSRLYGLSEKDFQRLKPYITIQPVKADAEKAAHQAVHDSLVRRYIQKFPEGTVVDINDSDTNMLKKIPGIGSYYASKICKYREQLGGFVSTRQISEIEGLPKDVARWFSVTETPTIRKTNVNKASFKELVRHPYLSFEQVKVIFTYRRKYGDLHSWQDLRLDDNFPPAAVEKLVPYFVF